MVGGRKTHSVGCVHGTQSVERARAEDPCLDAAQVIELGRLLLKAEDVIDGPAEIEWSLDDTGFKMLQARPLHVEEETADVDEVWAQKPRLRGHPAGVGWGAITGGGLLAGIGFTMALFIAGLALEGDALDIAKVGILEASVVAAILGVGLLVRVLPAPQSGGR